MFENPRRGRQARNFTTNAPKILDLKSSSEQIFSRKLPLGAPDYRTECSSSRENIVVDAFLSALTQHYSFFRNSQKNLISQQANKPAIRN